MTTNSTPPRRRADAPWRRWLILAAAWIAGPLLLLGGLECCLRAVGYGASSAPFRAVASDAGRAHVCNFDYLHNMFTVAPRVTQGEVEFAIPEAKEENSYRVFVFGSSAAFGWTHSASFAQMLQLMLLHRYPGVRFEFYNLANGGLNSSIMRPLARACVRLRPDAYLIYMGNNEVHGPYGLISEFQTRQGRALTPTDIRLHQWLRRLRLGQWLESLSRRAPSSDASQDAPATLRFDDPRLDQVWANYEYNLRDMFQSAAKAGAEVFVSTLGANLRHWPPQPDLLWDELSPEDRQRFDAAVAEGMAQEQTGHWQEALRIYADAAALSDASPYLHFRRAVCLWELGEYALSREHYEQALELDSFLWVRAKGAFNEAIRSAVTQFQGDNVVLVEGRQRLEEAAPHGVPGNESFADGCHFRPSGMYLLALAFLEEMAPRMPAWVRQRENPEASPPSLSDILEVLGLNEHLREDALQQLIKKSEEHGMDGVEALRKELEETRQAPIDRDPHRHLAALTPIIEQGVEDIQLAYKYMQCLGVAPGAVNETSIALARRLAERYSFDRRLQHQYAEALLFVGDAPGRESTYKRLLTLYPKDTLSYLHLVPLLLERGALGEAKTLLRQARKQDIDEGALQCLLGETLRHEGDAAALDAYMRTMELSDEAYPFAVNGFIESLRLFPAAIPERAAAVKALVETQYARRRDAKLGFALEALGDDEGALRLYRPLIEERPEAALGMGIAQRCAAMGDRYAEQGDAAAAIVVYRLALQAAPSDLLPLMRIGELYELLGNDEAALDAYRAVLLAAPESPMTAGKMDALLRRFYADPASAAAAWREIVDKHPDAATPRSYLQRRQSGT